MSLLIFILPVEHPISMLNDGANRPLYIYCIFIQSTRIESPKALYSMLYLIQIKGQLKQYTFYQYITISAK